MGSKKKGATINVYLEVLNLLNTMNVTGVYRQPVLRPTMVSLRPGIPEPDNQQVNPAAYRDLYSIYMDNPITTAHQDKPGWASCLISKLFPEF